MPTRRIGDEIPNKICFSKDHEPPQHQLFDNGVYEHVCSACGHKTIFTVNRPTFYWGDE
jgi:hypothetical protein